MPAEPTTKRTVGFIDGQNLFHAGREAFGYTFPNYDVVALSKTVCERNGWKLEQVRFYTGITFRRRSRTPSGIPGRIWAQATRLGE